MKEVNPFYELFGCQAALPHPTWEGMTGRGVQMNFDPFAVSELQIHGGRAGLSLSDAGS